MLRFGLQTKSRALPPLKTNNSLSALEEAMVALGLTRFHGQIRVKRSGSVKGVKDGQNEETLPS